MINRKYKPCQKADTVSIKQEKQKSSLNRKITAGKPVIFWWLFLLLQFPVFSFSIESANNASLREEVPFYTCFTDAAELHNIDRNWLIAVAIIESSLDPSAISKANAMGIMQIKWPQTAKHLGIEDQRVLFDPCSSIEAGARYLIEVRTPYLQLPKEERNNMMLAAYRIGPNALKSLNLLPPVAEEYIKKVRLKKNSLDQLIEISQQNCILEELKNLSLKTHHPLERGQRSIEWITQNHENCDQTSWKQLINNLPIWLGTAHSSLKLQALLSRLFSS